LYLSLTILSRLHKSIAVTKYYGKGRNDDIEQLLDFDIVFTTYHTISASMNHSDTKIFHIEWFRIVLDEGVYHEQTPLPPSLDFSQPI